MTLLADRPGGAATGPRQWWERRWFVAILVLIAAVPLLYPDVPPLVDLLGHLGRYRVQLDLDQSPWLGRYYDFQWAVIGNLGVDLLIIPLRPLLGLEPSVKLVVLAIPPLTVGGFLWVAREVHHRLPPTALFALPFAFSFPFQFGFANFTLAMALIGIVPLTVAPFAGEVRVTTRLPPGSGGSNCACAGTAQARASNSASSQRIQGPCAARTAP